MHCSSNSLLVNELRAGTQVNSCVTPPGLPIYKAASLAPSRLERSRWRGGRRAAG
jgi:hypothetical protein